MEIINKTTLDTILRLSNTVQINNGKKTIDYKYFWSSSNNQGFYKELGKLIIDKIKNDEKFKHMCKLDYKWAIENNHPIIKYSQRYRENLQKKQEKADLNIVDLFCGAGGLSLGFVQNGFQVSFANDIDDSCINTYIHNHPSTPSKNIVLKDIDLIIDNIKSYIRYKNTDVVVGGPPCQGFSMANRQRIKNDPRNRLYKYFIEAVNTLQPKVFVMENVKGMQTVANQVVEDFMEIGYFTDFKVFNGKNFSVPQNRERLIFIGTKKENHSKKILKAIEESKKNYESFVLKDALFGMPSLQASSKKNSTNSYDKSGGLVLKNDFPKSNNYINLINNNEIQYVFLNSKARYNNPRDIEIYNRLNQGDNSTDEKIADIMPYKTRAHIFKDKYYKLKENEVCKTITAHMKFDCNMYIHPNEPRGLTPREAARVQTFPDNYFFQGPYTKTYMQIGNSVPPLLGRAISSIILNYLKGIENQTP